VSIDQIDVPRDLLTPQGIVFRCTVAQFVHLRPAMDAYLSGYGLRPSDVMAHMNVPSHTLSLTMAEPDRAGDTLGLIDDVAHALTEELVELPSRAGTKTQVLTVSKKEIVFAMLQSGRASYFQGAACDVQALIDHVGVRQNIVAWSEVLAWKWPDGGPANFNGKYWKRGLHLAGYSLHAAVNDIFVNQQRYSMGCYTASKLVMVQGILDYYHRVKHSPDMLRDIETKLMQGGSPLSSIEPGVMWSFEPDSTPEDRERPGKLLTIQFGIPGRNFIPGDWSYFLNTDALTHEKTGYEGSNTIYLGRGRFSDFYNDHNHYYTYKEKLHEVYQWRNRVFNDRRDAAKIQPLTAGDYVKLGTTPEQGGIQLDLRVVPQLFGYREAPLLLSGDR